MPFSTRRADFRRYRELTAEWPDLFASESNGIQILLEDAEIRAARRRIARRNRAKGLPSASASVGVLAEDAYILVLRDAVRFPDGSLGTHNRVIYRQAGGIGVLAVFQGRIVLIRVYRHPIRQWIWELPRGSVEIGHGHEDTVRREIAEEVGGTVTRMERLGQTRSDTSLCDGQLDLYFAELSQLGEPQLSEGIGEVATLTPAEFEDRIRMGEIRDAHAMAAFTMARSRGLI
ncbi:NTP pyrophosphohydrolase [Paramagnetospirillum kuznetsovii]|uniref:GDP-mannose pyrophosphatase n=1 Tax=Paramagnetospirillum kuznetsovii TaxID=2053833 RepID=A0A364NU27_9PROT|nr:NUDIX hydrolase [Paramagnetospirillum kuznetsovii]RAU20510.1 NTP pyrophosphohydrolase [Paramagnetospirillum kuznetsovii]